MASAADATFSAPSKVHFVSFGGGNDDYRAAGVRIERQARSMGMFDEIRVHSDADLREDPEFWPKFGSFCERNRKGWGFWVWKPYLVERYVRSFVRDGDILVFADAGCEVNSLGKERLAKYFADARASPGKFVLTIGGSPQEAWTKEDVWEYFGIGTEDPLRRAVQYQGGYWIVCVTEETRELIDEWAKSAMFEGGRLFADRPTLTKNREGFRAHRHDQSSFSILVQRHNAILYVIRAWTGTDWKALKHEPILCTRTRNGGSVVDEWR